MCMFAWFATFDYHIKKIFTWIISVVSTSILRGVSCLYTMQEYFARITENVKVFDKSRGNVFKREFGGEERL